MERTVLHLQTLRNKRKAAAEPGRKVRDARTPLEERLDLQLQRLLDELDEREQNREDRIRKLENRLLMLNEAVMELVNRLESAASEGAE